MRLRKERRDLGVDIMECTPVTYRGRTLLLECVRPPSGGRAEDYFLRLRDLDSGEPVVECGHGHGLGCALATTEALYLFATRVHCEADGSGNSWNDVSVFRSEDLRRFEQQPGLAHRDGEAIFNTSVCPAPGGYVMAYETTHPDYVSFTVRFAFSADLRRWEPLPEALLGPNRYTACPCVRYVGGYYHVLYLEALQPRRFETWLARSRNLRNWELSPHNPILTASEEEGCNNSDPDLFEHEGSVYLYYATGDQLTWGNLRRAVFEGTLAEFFESAFA